MLLPCHALNFLQYADQIITLDGETIREEGSYSELIVDNGPFAELMKVHASVTNDEQDEEGAESADITEATEEPIRAGNKVAEKDALTQKDALTPMLSEAEAAKKGKITQAEERAKGTVDKEVCHGIPSPPPKPPPQDNPPVGAKPQVKIPEAGLFTGQIF